MVALHKKGEETIISRLDPLGRMNVCTKGHGDPSDSHGNISIWSKLVDQLIN